MKGLFVGFIMLALTLIVADFSQSEAAEVYMKNGDHLTGNILVSDEQTVRLETYSMGIIDIQVSGIKDVLGDEQLQAKIAQKKAEEEKPKHWDGKVYGGLSRQRGNTKKTELDGGFLLHYKKEKVHEFHVKGDAYYSAANLKMDAQKYSGMIRYAVSFGESGKWYHFYKVEGDHDRFANIDNRIIPSLGLGYWFADSDDFKLMAEAGGGIEHTRFRDDKEDQTELTFIPRLYVERKVIGESRVSNDLVVYPSLTDRGKYRWRMDTQFKNPITDRLSLSFNWINDYNSDPGADVKKHDMRLSTRLEYNF